MKTITLELSGGLVTARPPEKLELGELQTATGVWYRPGDRTSLHVMPGPSVFGRPSTAAIKGMALCQFDAGGDRLLAYANGTIYSATPGTSGTFVALVSGLSASPSAFSASHAADRWYLANGVDFGRVLKGDGTVRRHGMLSPQITPEVTVGTSPATSVYPANEATSSAIETVNTGWTNYNYARDGVETTAATATAVSPGTQIAKWRGWAAATGSGRVLQAAWSLRGAYRQDPSGTGSTGGGGDSHGVGGSADAGFVVTVTLEASEDQGVTWTTVLSVQRTTATAGWQYAQHQISGSSIDNANIQFRASMKYTSGKSTATLQIRDVWISTGATVGVTSTTGCYYVLTEYDQNEGIESAWGIPSKLVTYTSATTASVTLPAAPQTSNATHYFVYRTTDGGTIPANAWKIGEIPVSATAFLDIFDVGLSERGSRILSYVSASTEFGAGLWARDKEPPILRHLNFYKGSLVGLGLDKRSLFYSESGLPDSWPEINVITSFPIPEHDELITTASVGETLLLLAREAVFAMNDLPRVFLGNFNASEVRVLRGAPGCVAQDAVTVYSLNGEPRCAYVSRYGVMVTDGQATWRISDDLSWSDTVSQDKINEAVLRWDPDRSVLLFAYNDGTGSINNRYMLFHMGQEHQKPNNMPRITGPHSQAITAACSGVVANRYRTYTGGLSGYVYIQAAGGSTDWSVTTGRIVSNWEMFRTSRLSFRHRGFLTDASVNVTFRTGIETSQNTQEVARSLLLTGNDSKPLGIMRGGDWAQIELGGTDTGDGTIVDLRLEIDKMGRSGVFA